MLDLIQDVRVARHADRADQPQHAARLRGRRPHPHPPARPAALRDQPEGLHHVRRGRLHDRRQGAAGGGAWRREPRRAGVRHPRAAPRGARASSSPSPARPAPASRPSPRRCSPRSRRAAPGRAALVPMDGYHFDNAVLAERGLAAAQGRAARPSTSTGWRATSRASAPAAATVAVPVFDRDARPGAGRRARRSGPRHRRGAGRGQLPPARPAALGRARAALRPDALPRRSTAAELRRRLRRPLAGARARPRRRRRARRGQRPAQRGAGRGARALRSGRPKPSSGGTVRDLARQGVLGVPARSTRPKIRRVSATEHPPTLAMARRLWVRGGVRRWACDLLRGDHRTINNYAGARCNPIMGSLDRRPARPGGPPARAAERSVEITTRLIRVAALAGRACGRSPPIPRLRPCTRGAAAACRRSRRVRPAARPIVAARPARPRARESSGTGSALRGGPVASPPLTPR